MIINKNLKCVCTAVTLQQLYVKGIYVHMYVCVF